jgi:protein phosphatase
MSQRLKSKTKTRETDQGKASIESLISKHFAPVPPLVEVELGAVSHPGKVRSKNEDHYVVVQRRRCRTVLRSNLPEGSLPHAEDHAYVMVVADGVGGEAFGEMASMLAIRTGWDLGLSEIKWTLKVGEQEVREFKEKAELYLRLIDRALIQEAKSQPKAAGMATTLTAAYTVGYEAFIFHAGDSRAYLVHEGTLQQLTRDHTVAQNLADAGLISPETVAVSSFRSVLTNCIGGSKEGVKVDVTHVQLAEGDSLLLCTDGLTDMVDEDGISQTINAHPQPQDACQALLDQALDGGGKDNVTIVLARFTQKRES